MTGFVIPNGPPLAYLMMSTTHTQFDGLIPEIYDAHLGPLFFEFSARDLAQRVAAGSPADARVLEIACGTGISTEHLQRAMPDAEIHATDLNQAMLNVAQSKRGGLPNVTFSVADVQSLPFGDSSYEAVVCQFGLMFFPDKAAALREIHRALRPGGLLAMNVWDSLEHNPIADVTGSILTRFFESDPPTFLEVPFGFSNIDSAKDLLQDAGFRNLEIAVVSETVELDDASHIARGFVEGSPAIHEIHDRATALPHVIIEAVAQAIDREFGPGELRIPLQEIVFTATAAGQ